MYTPEERAQTAEILEPIADHFRSHPGVSAIVGPRVSADGLAGIPLPAVQISLASAPFDEGAKHIQLDGWVEARSQSDDDTPQRIEELRRALLDAVDGLAASDTVVELTRVQVTGVAPGLWPTLRRRATINITLHPSDRPLASTESVED